LSSYTTQSFLLSPKSYGNSFHGVGLFLKCTLWQSMVLLLCPARLQNPKSVQSMAPAVLPKLPLVIPWAPLLSLAQPYRKETKPMKRSTARQQKILISARWERRVLASLARTKNMPAQ
jgi:hypothetical protein